MIFIGSNDGFFLKSLNSLLVQKNFLTTSDKSSKFFFEIFLKFENNKLKIIFANKDVVLRTPIPFNIFFSKLNELLMNNHVSISDFDYNPISQSISIGQNTCNLGVIHNQIMSNLILNLDKGIDKIKLYRLIWPLDKDLQMNKLDTHITNLKNKVNGDLNLDLNFTSNSGTLKLIID